VIEPPIFGHYVDELDIAIELFRAAKRGKGDAVVAVMAETLCSQAEALVAAWHQERRQREQPTTHP
jgi:hypothetical protein